MNKLISLYLLLLLIVSCAVYHPVTERKSVNTSVSNEASMNDTDIVVLVKPFRDILEKDMLRVLAISDVELVKDKPESPMTNFMSDVLLEEGQNYCKAKNISMPQVAYVNYGGIRSTLPKGEINVQKIFELMPFENEMVILKIKGSKLYEMAQRVVDRGGDGVAGVKIGIKDKMLSSFQIGGKDFDVNQSYWIVTNDYVASGGDSMTMFAEPEEFIQTGKTIRELIIKNLEEKTKAGQHITAQKDGRIFYE